MSAQQPTPRGGPRNRGLIIGGLLAAIAVAIVVVALVVSASGHLSDQQVASCVQSQLNGGVPVLDGCGTAAAAKDANAKRFNQGVSNVTCHYQQGDTYLCTTGAGTTYSVAYDGGNSIYMQLARRRP